MKAVEGGHHSLVTSVNWKPGVQEVDHDSKAGHHSLVTSVNWKLIGHSIITFQIDSHHWLVTSVNWKPSVRVTLRYTIGGTTRW